jgi:hypothetical protein
MQLADAIMIVHMKSSSDRLYVKTCLAYPGAFEGLSFKKPGNTFIKWIIR